MEDDKVPFHCDLCNGEADPVVEYSTSVTCSHPTCGKRYYHTACWEHFLRACGFHKGRNIGYGCPRGHGKCPEFHDNPCKGRADATHHRMIGKVKRKVVAPPAPQDQARQKRENQQLPKKINQKPGGPKMAAGGVAFDRELLAQQVAARREELEKAQAGEGVSARLRGGVVLGEGEGVVGAIPGMEFACPGRKAAGKKRRARGVKGGVVGPGDEAVKAAGSAGKNGQAKASYAQQPCQPISEWGFSGKDGEGNKMDLAGHHRLMAAGQGLVFDVARFNAMVGVSADISDEEQMDEEYESDEEEAEIEEVVGSGTEAGEGTGSDMTRYSSHVHGHDNDSGNSPRLSHARAVGGLSLEDVTAFVQAGVPPSELRFDFSHLSMGDGASDEMMQFMASLPREVSDEYLSQYVSYMQRKHGCLPEDENGYPPCPEDVMQQSLSRQHAQAPLHSDTSLHHQGYQAPQPTSLAPPVRPGMLPIAPLPSHLPAIQVPPQILHGRAMPLQALPLGLFPLATPRFVGGNSQAQEGAAFVHGGAVLGATPLVSNQHGAVAFIGNPPHPHPGALHFTTAGKHAAMGMVASAQGGVYLMGGGEKKDDDEGELDMDDLMALCLGE